MKVMTEGAYVEKHGLVCPHCRSDDIEGGPVEIEDDYAFQEVSCSNCNASWNDVYELVGYSNLTDGDES